MPRRLIADRIMAPRVGFEPTYSFERLINSEVGYRLPDRGMEPVASSALAASELRTRRSTQ